LDNSAFNHDLDVMADADSRQQEEWDKRISSRLAEIRAQEAEYDPAVQAEIHERRAYRKRKHPEGLGPDLRRADQHVLRRIAQLNDLGITEISVTELANSTGYGRRQVQYSLGRLVDMRLLRRRIRPSNNPRRHHPSALTLLASGWVWLGRTPPAHSKPDFSAQKIARPSEIKNKTTCTEAEGGAAATARANARATPSAAAREPEPAPPAAAAQDGFTTGKQGATGREELGRPKSSQIGDQIATPRDSRALARMAAEKLNPARSAAEDPWSVIDAARRQRLSLFHPDAWSRGVGAHGREVALLAAALALLRQNDGHGRPIRSAAGYLGGMLRLSPGALNPAPSLTPLLT
jgi:hypothetical protein